MESINDEYLSNQKWYNKDYESHVNNSKKDNYSFMLSLYKQNKLKWKSNNGEETLVSNLTDKHLLNIITFLNGKKVISWVKILKLEKNKRKL